MAVLKARSPSCGLGEIHNGRFDGGLTGGNGIFAEMLLAAGIPVMTEATFTLPYAELQKAVDKPQQNR